MGLIVIRHGHTLLLEETRNRGISGKPKTFLDVQNLAEVRKDVSGDSLLSSKGEEQIRNISTNVAAFYIGAVFISEARRTRQTYDILKENNPDLPLPEVDSGLNQIESGVLHGIINENSQAYFESLPDSVKRGKLFGCNYGNPDGETVLMATQRIYNFLDSIKELYTNTNVLLITHKSAIRIIETYFNRDIHENASILDFDPSNGQILTYGRIFQKEEIENPTRHTRTVTPGAIARLVKENGMDMEDLLKLIELMSGREVANVEGRG